MYGDFSRLPFARRHYSAVWAQQGRYQLDADLNEQTAITLDFLRTLATDFIGPFGGHVTRAGFAVTMVPGRDAADHDLALSAGHYYVHGLRCEVDESTAVSYRHQPHGPAPAAPLPEKAFIAALFVWERSVSAIDDPTLIEPGLGPDAPDTTTRTQVAWELQVTPRLPDDKPVTGEETAESIVDAYCGLNASLAKGGRLKARLPLAGGADQDPGTAPVPIRYRGPENQLYRIEIHTGGPANTATWKWSRENGSVVIPLESLVGDQAVVARFGRDARTDVDVGDWLELVDDTWVPDGDPPALLHVSAIDHLRRRLTLAGGDGSKAYADRRLHPYLRRWDQHPQASDLGQDNAMCMPADGDLWCEVEDGVQVQFSVEKDAPVYRRGDFWVVPARSATGGVIWPTSADDNAVALPPYGPARYYAPLAMVTNIDGKLEVRDLRSLFTHLSWPPEDEEHKRQP